MLTIICGEDNVASREYFAKIKKTYQTEKEEPIEIRFSDLENIYLWQAESQGLFTSRKIYFIENLNKKISKKNNPKLMGLLDKIIKDRDLEIFDWEDGVPKRYLKIENIDVKEFRPKESIFQLLDDFYPKNAKSFITRLHNLSDNTDEYFILAMLTKHVKQLILVKIGTAIKMFPWQLVKLKKQASLWELKELINFYENIHKLDLAIKTSSTPYSVRDTLDILAVYFL